MFMEPKQNVSSKLLQTAYSIVYIKSVLQFLIESQLEKVMQWGTIQHPTM